MWQGTRQAAVIAVLLITSASVLLYVRVNAQPTLDEKDWPAFRMVFEEWRYGLGANGAPGTQRIELIYNNELNWRMEVLFHSNIPDLAGSWTTYNGKEIRHFDPRFGETVTDVSEEEGIYVPSEWLKPYYISKLLKEKNVKENSEVAKNKKDLVFTEQTPCQSELTEAERKIGMQPCKDGKRENRRQIIYLDDIKVPMQVVDTVDNVEVQKITVEEFSLQ